MSHRPLVSVVMPFRNSAKSIAMAVRSILRQTVRDFELIAIDDGSDDEGHRVVESFRDPRIRLYRNETHLGVSATRNRGMALMRGTFMAPMDADDFCHRDRLARTLQNLVDHPEHGLCGGWARIVGRRWPGILMRQPCGPRAVRAHFLYGMPFFNDALLFRNEFCTRHGLSFPEHISAGEDYDLTLRCARLFPVDNVPAVILDYHVSPQGISATAGKQASMGRLQRHREELTTLLGCLPGEDQIRVHTSLGNGSGAVDPADLRRRREWMEGLIEANGIRRVYDPAGLLEATAFVWFRICRNSAHLGREAWRAWARSPWRRYYHPLLEEMLSFAGSWGLSMVQARRRQPQGGLRGL